MSVLQQVKKILSQTEEITTKYDTAIDNNKTVLSKLQAELPSKKKQLEEVHKAFILGNITGDDYLVEKASLENLEKQIADLEREIALIGRYKHDDGLKHVSDIQKVEWEFNEKKQEEILKLQYQMVEAEKQYLHALQGIRNKYMKLVQPKNMLEKLKANLGLQKDVISPTILEDLRIMKLGEGIRSVLPNTQCIEDVLSSGVIPHDLSKVIEQGKQEGYLK